jgi:uncharacterized membrane-anchored protein YitT (DUF2179 family)
MNRLLEKIVRHTVLDGSEESDLIRAYSNYRLAKGYRELIVLGRRYLKDFALVVFGIFSASFGFKGFLLTNHFIDGGATGISMLLAVLTSIPLHLFIIAVNVPFIILAYFTMGSQFAVRTALAITGLSLCLAFVTFPNVTDDNLLVAVFGGLFLGTGIGFAIRGGAVIDGTEVLAIYLSRKSGATIGDVILIINVLIFSAAAYFLGVDIALYSMVTYAAASKAVDFIVEGFEEYIGVTIISSHCEEIRSMIITKMGRGVTVYQAKRGFGKRGESRNADILYTVITRLEYNRLNTEIERIEPDAFLVVHRVKDVKGGMIKKRPLHS